MIRAKGRQTHVVCTMPSSRQERLEGCDAFIPGMKVALDACLEHGAEKAVIGMPHRGRLNMLANVVRKPLE